MTPIATFIVNAQTGSSFSYQATPTPVAHSIVRCWPTPEPSRQPRPTPAPTEEVIEEDAVIVDTITPATLRPGSLMAIRGSGFSNINTIALIGSGGASDFEVGGFSDNHLQFRLPAEVVSGHYNLFVHNFYGSSQPFPITVR